MCDFEQVSNSAIGNICQQLSECLYAVISQIDLIEKHLEDSVKCIVYSPFLKASRVIDFLAANQQQDGLNSGLPEISSMEVDIVEDTTVPTRKRSHGMISTEITSSV